VTLLDFVHPKRDVLIRRFEITNISAEPKEFGMMTFSEVTSTNPDISSSLFDFRNEALIQYRNSTYIGISSDSETMQFQLGNNAQDAAINTYLNGFDSIGMMKDAAVSWNLGRFEPNETKHFNLYICASDTLKNCKSLIKAVKQDGAASLLEDTELYWKGYLSSTKPLKCQNVVLTELYKRSLLVFKLMYDKKSGALLAAPELDEYFTKCGRYAYCWGRDAAFITTALDSCGLNDCVDNFYKWARDNGYCDNLTIDRKDENGNYEPDNCRWITLSENVARANMYTHRRKTKYI
jgi:GH15 family glucan-1,4-alpha-glucosidase